MTTSIKTCSEAIEVDFKLLGEARRFLERMGKNGFAVEIEKAVCRIVQLDNEQCAEPPTEQLKNCIC